MEFPRFYASWWMPINNSGVLIRVSPWNLCYHLTAFMHFRLCLLVDWVLGWSRSNFKLAVLATENNNAQIMFPQLLFQGEGYLVEFQCCLGCFLLRINRESLPALETADYRMQFRVRNAKIKRGQRPEMKISSLTGTDDPPTEAYHPDSSTDQSPAFYVNLG